jgi:hypothetical protein
MYTACTFRLAAVSGLSLVQPVPQVFIHIALIAWSVTFAGWAVNVLKPSKRAPSAANTV